MNTLLLRTLELKKSPSVQTFAQYREAESQNCRHTSVTSEGELLEHQTLELRVHPPNVTVDNESYDDRTVITVDSANRPGTLVEVVQCLTELGLNVKRARISSDGGWFVDEFHVCEQQGRKVTSESKLKVIKAVLNVEYESDSEHDSSQHGPAGAPLAQRQQSEAFEEGWQHSTVFEMAGQDRSGLLADVLQLLTHNGCDVRSAAVWTYGGRVAFVVSVVEGCGQPIRDVSKLARLKQLLHGMMDAGGNGIVNAQPVKGLIHYERRLHQLMLKEEEKEWVTNKDAILARAGILPPNSSCSCSCHQQLDASGGGANGALAGLQGLGYLSLSNGVQQQQPQQSQPHPRQQDGLELRQANGAAGATGQPWRCGGCSSCCCDQEQQELHIVRSDTVVAPTPPHHSPSSSISSLPASEDYMLAGGERLPVSRKASRPDVTIQHYSHLNYWLVTIRCKDRNKLFFDTVCTLSDLNYDVYHGAIDGEGELAVQLYYIRPRFGDFFWDSVKATKLRVMLEAAIQRRFPPGLKVHVRHKPSHMGDSWLADLTAAWKEAGLWITRAKVRAYADHTHTLYVMDANGQTPELRKVQAACQIGGGINCGPSEGLPLGVSPPGMGSATITAAAPSASSHVPAATGSKAAVAAGVDGGAAGNATMPGQGGKFFFALQQRAWDGSPSSFTSL